MYGQRELEAFIAVLDEGTVSAAAHRLFRTQPAVSRQIASLERQVGATLFRRVTTGMVATNVAERLEPMARDIVRRGRRAGEVMEGIVRGQRSFVAAAPEMTSLLVLAPFIAAGGPISDIVISTPGEVYARLHADVDLAVTTSAPSARLRGMRLLTLALLCQVPEGHPFAQQDAVELTDLVAAPFFTPGQGSAVWAQIQQIAGREGLPLEMATLGADAPIIQARAAAGHGPCVVIEPPRFGLESRPLQHRGQTMQCSLFAGWERSHYAGEDIRRVVEQLAAFATEHVAGLYPTTR